MPYYDFACPHGHAFEENVKVSEREAPIPCQGMVRQLCDETDEGAVKETVTMEPRPNSVIGELQSREDAKVITECGVEPAAPTVEVWVRYVPCILKATRVNGGISDKAPTLHYGFGANRDRAMEGRWDGQPIKRGVGRRNI